MIRYLKIILILYHRLITSFYIISLMNRDYFWFIFSRGVIIANIIALILLVSILITEFTNIDFVIALTIASFFVGISSLIVTILAGRLLSETKKLSEETKKLSEETKTISAESNRLNRRIKEISFDSHGIVSQIQDYIKDIKAISKDNIMVSYLGIIHNIDMEVIRVRSLIEQHNYIWFTNDRLGAGQRNQLARQHLRVRRGIIWTVHKYVSQAITYRKWITKKGQRTRLANPVIRLISEVLVWESDNDIRVINGEARNIANTIKKLIEFDINEDKERELIQLFGDLLSERKDDEADDKVFIENAVRDIGRTINDENIFNHFEKLTVEQRDRL